MPHRIREPMPPADTLDPTPMGGAGWVVEADETYFGKQAVPMPSKNRRGAPYLKGGAGPAGKRAIVALVERGGSVRTFHVAFADKETVLGIVRDNVDRETHLHTDESLLYGGADKLFSAHETVTHSHKEYVRGDVHTNTV